MRSPLEDGWNTRRIRVHRPTVVVVTAGASTPLKDSRCAGPIEKVSPRLTSTSSTRSGCVTMYLHCPGGRRQTRSPWAAYASVARIGFLENAQPFLRSGLRPESVVRTGRSWTSVHASSFDLSDTSETERPNRDRDLAAVTDGQCIRGDPRTRASVMSTAATRNVRAVTCCYRWTHTPSRPR